MKECYYTQKTVFNRDCLVLALQVYLEHYYVTVSDADNQWCVTIYPKDENTACPKNEEFNNRLIEAAFLVQQAEKTHGLRAYILQHSLLPYTKDHEN